MCNINSIQLHHISIAVNLYCIFIKYTWVINIIFEFAYGYNQPP